MRRFCVGGRRVLGSHQIEGEENGVVVVGIGKNKLILELRFQVVCEFFRGGGVVHIVGVPDVGPAVDEETGVGTVRILEVAKHMLPAGGLIREQSSLRLPSGVVVQRLEYYAIHIQIVRSDLPIKVDIVVLRKVDGKVQRHAWEACFKGLLEAILLMHLISLKIEKVSQRNNFCGPERTLRARQSQLLLPSELLDRSHREYGSRLPQNC